MDKSFACDIAGIITQNDNKKIDKNLRIKSSLLHKKIKPAPPKMGA